MTARSITLSEEVEVKVEGVPAEEVPEVPVIVPGEGEVGTMRGGGIE